MYLKKQNRYLLARIFILIFLFLNITYSPLVQAVPGGGVAGPNWTALLPYNTLWPLWSPALSPVDPITALPTPIVSNLAPTTVLPVQPGLTWDPSIIYPWLLYNTPLGMVYFDPLFGINLWPPKYLTLGPIALPPNYATLPPINAFWINTYVPFANTLYLASLTKFAPPPVKVAPVPFFPAVPPIATPITPTLLTPTTILGL